MHYVRMSKFTGNTKLQNKNQLTRQDRWADVDFVGQQVLVQSGLLFFVQFSQYELSTAVHTFSTFTLLFNDTVKDCQYLRRCRNVPGTELIPK